MRKLAVVLGVLVLMLVALTPVVAHPNDCAEDAATVPGHCSNSNAETTVYNFEVQQEPWTINVVSNSTVATNHDTTGPGGEVLNYNVTLRGENAGETRVAASKGNGNVANERNPHS